MGRVMLAAGVLWLACAAPVRANDLETLGLRGAVSSYDQKLTAYENGAPVDKGLTVKASFDRSGRYLRSETYDRQRLTDLLEATYSASGDLQGKRVTRYDAEGKVLTVTESGYDASGAMVRETIRNGAGTITSQWVSERAGTGRRVTSQAYSTTQETLFDAAGRIVSRTQRRPGDVMVPTWTYSYDSSGRLQSAQYTGPMVAARGSWSCEYGEAGRPIRVRHASSSGALLSLTVYEYTRAGALTADTVTLYGSDGSVISETRRERDAGGRIVVEKSREPAHDFSSVKSNEYDASSRLIGARQADTFGDVFQEWSSGYDSAGASALSSLSIAGIVTGSRTDNRYDAAGRLIASTTLDLSGNVTRKTGKVYNARGDVEEESTYNPDGSLQDRWTYAYDYDARGNWTYRRALYTDNAAERYGIVYSELRRSIQYYP